MQLLFFQVVWQGREQRRRYSASSLPHFSLECFGHNYSYVPIPQQGFVWWHNWRTPVVSLPHFIFSLAHLSGSPDPSHLESIFICLLSDWNYRLSDSIPLSDLTWIPIMYPWLLPFFEGLHIPRAYHIKTWNYNLQLNKFNIFKTEITFSHPKLSPPNVHGRSLR